MKYVTNHVELGSAKGTNETRINDKIGSAKGTIMVRIRGIRVEKNGPNGMYGVTKLRV